MSEIALATGSFPTSVLEPLLSTVKEFTQSGITNANAAFRKYLNGDDNKTIRLFAAEAEGIVEQTSTVQMLRRLTASSSDDPVPGYGYGGTIELVYAGGETTKQKLHDLLPELKGEDEGKVAEATVKLVAFPFADEPDEVNLGLTGGAPDDKLNEKEYPEALKVKFFLRLQPYRSEAKQQVMVGGENARTIALDEQKSVGKETFALRGYYVPTPEITDEDWAYYTGANVPEDVRRNAEILKWLTDESQTSKYKLQPIDGINAFNKDGALVDCDMGSPAGERVFQVVASAIASIKGDKAILFNFAEYDQNLATFLSFEYIEKLLSGAPTESELAFLPERLGGNAEGNGVAETIRAYESRKAYLEGIQAADKFLFLDEPDLQLVQDAAGSLSAGQVLYLQLGPVPRPLFYWAYANSGLPGVFTSMGLANLTLSLNNYYYSVAPPLEGGVQYPETVLTKHDNGEVPFELQTVADQIGASMSDWPAKVEENPAEVQATFIKEWQAESETGKFKSYIKRVAGFYERPDNDKLNLGLSFFNYVIETENLPDDELKKLYDKIAEAIKENPDELDLVPGIFGNDSVIGKFFFKLLDKFGGKLIVKNPELDPKEAPEKLERFKLKGPTDVFGVETELEAEYTAPEKRVDSQTKFTATDTRASWSIPGVPWIVFSKPFIRMDVVNTANETALPTPGAVGGTISGSDGKPEFTFEFEAPVQDDKWLLKGAFAEPQSIGSFYQLAGGVNIVASLPSPLNVLTDLGLSNFELLYNAKEGEEKAEYLNFIMKTSQVLPLLPQIDLKDFQVEFNIQNPQDVKTRKWTTTATSNFEFEEATPVALAEDGKALVAVSVKVPAVVFKGELKSGTIRVAALLKTFVPWMPKDALDFLFGSVGDPTITAFAMSYQKEKDALDVSTQLNTTFTVFELIRLDTLSFQISRKRENNVAINTGSIVGILPNNELLKFTAAVSAVYGGETKGWTFLANTTSNVPLGKMIEYYLQWSLGDFGDTLAIEKLSLKVEEKTRSWEFEGATTAFDTPLGFAAKASAKLGENKGTTTLGSAKMAAFCDCDSPPVQSRFLPEFMPSDEPEPGKYGDVEGSLIWENIKLNVSYNFNADPKKNQFCIEWLVGEVGLKACLTTDPKTGDEIATFNLAGETVGSIVETMVSWARGGQAFALSAPWNVLNSIPLDVFAFVWNVTKGTVSFEILIGPIELGFARIEKIGVTYAEDPDDPAKKKRVMVELIGRFVWQQGEDSDKLNWDAADPNSTPAPPGNGNKYLDLRLLAMGQHVTYPGFKEVTKVQEAIEEMNKLDEADPCKIPNVEFAPDSDWLFGTDFGVLKLEKEKENGGQTLLPADYTPDESALVRARRDLLAEEEGGGYFLTLQIIFNDPVLYGLRVALAGKPAKILKGLDFQIMYRQISDSVGVYQAEITLPDIMRRITVGAYTIIFPVFGIEIYTNGDFQVDIGFPWNQDFTRSFTIEATFFIGPIPVPVLGSAGFYFGKLSSETTNKVPAATNGTFNPVIVFGFGAQIGLGKSFEAGILKAGFSLTAFGILEGVIAKWNPYRIEQSGNSSDSQVQGQYYFWLQGTFGIIGKLYGSIDFVIIKADVNVAIKVYAQITFASYEPIPITVAAQVDVSVKVTINLGLFKIKISFSFHLLVKETFTLENSGTAPWKVEGSQNSGFLAEPRRARLTESRRWLMAERFEVTLKAINWGNLQEEEAAKLELKGYLAAALTMAGDEANTPAEQIPCYVAMMFIESTPPASEDATSSALKAVGQATDTPFEELAKRVLCWAAAAVLGPQTPSQVKAKQITKDQLEALLEELSDSTNATPIPPADVDQFLNQQLKTFEVQKPPKEGEVDATYFPIASELKLVLPQYGEHYEALSYKFDAYNSAPTEYLAALREYFNQLAVKVQEEMDPPQPMVAATDGSLSLGSYIQLDYFVLLARQMVQAASDGLRDFKLPVNASQKVDDIVAWVNNNGLVEGDGGPRAFTIADLFVANGDHQLTGDKPLMVGIPQFAVAGGESFNDIAAAEGGAFTGGQLATQNQDALGILHPGATVTYPGKEDHTVTATDTLDSIANGFQVTFDELLERSNVLTSNDLLEPGALLTLVFVIRCQVQPADSFNEIALQPNWNGSFNGAQLATVNRSAAQILTSDAVVTYPDQDDYMVQPTDTLNSLAAHFNVTDFQDFLNNSNVLTSTKLLASMAILVTPAVNYTTSKDTPDTLTGVAGRYGLSTGGLVNTNNGKIVDLFSSSKYLDIPHLASFNVGELINEAQRSLAIQHLSGMASRYYLHGLRLPTTIATESGGSVGVTPNYKGMWVKDVGGTLTLPPVAGLFALTGQQFRLPNITEEDGTFTISFTEPPAWLTFAAGADSISVVPGSPETAAITAVSVEARKQPLDTDLQFLGGGRLSDLEMTTYPLASALIWQAVGTVPLPYGAASGMQDLRLWKLPDSLVNLPDPGSLGSRALNPRFKVEIASYDEATGGRKTTDAPYYGWASTIGFTVKKTPPQGGPAGETTYEISGSEGNDIVLMERLLNELVNDDSAIFSLVVTYPPNASGDAPAGVQSDDQSMLTFGIAQVNLSTVTRPPTEFTSNLAFEDVPESEATLLNSGPLEFIRLLWEASITRNGGFFLYYYDEARKAGLPDRIFNDRDEALINVVVLYSKPGGDFEHNRVANYMNAIATGTSIDQNSVVTAEADPLPVDVPATADTRLVDLAFRYYGDVGQLAENEHNAALKLTTSAVITVRSGVYEVGSTGSLPGGNLKQIADYFRTTEQAVKDANPKLDWTQDQPPLTAVRLPTIEVKVGTSDGSDTLGEIAAYYGADLGGIGADNSLKKGIFAVDPAQNINVDGGPVTRSATVPVGVQPVSARRRAITKAPDPATEPTLFLQSNFSLLGYRIATNVYFEDKSNTVGLPAGPTSKPLDSDNLDKIAVPRKLVEGDLWYYDNAVPYPQFALDCGGNDDADLSLPLEENSPYCGLDSMLQIDFSWQDLYGNLLITDLTEPFGNPKWPNEPPLLIGYTDMLIGLGQWPSVTSGWGVAAVGADTQIDLLLNFSKDSYEPETVTDSGEEPWRLFGDETPTWQMNAKRDLLVVTNLLYQLKDPHGIRYSVTTSLLPTEPLYLNDTQINDELLPWVEAIYRFLDDRANGGTTVPPPTPNPLPLALAFDKNKVNTNQIFELELNFTIERVSGLAAGDFAASTGVLVAPTEVNPGDPAPTAGDTMLVLREFAADFEAALSNPAVDLLKVATGVDRERISTSRQHGALWVVRLGLTATEGISYEVRDVEQALIFAPKPISTELISRSADIFPYKTGEGIDWDVGFPRDFVGIDMDTWGRQFFSGIDSVLTPEFTGPMQILQEKRPIPGVPTYLERILDLKQNLADLVKDWMVPVFEEPTPTDAQLTAIREVFKQQLLVLLGNAYTTRAGLEFLADVNALIDDPLGTQPPQLYGNVKQHQETPREESLPESAITFTAPKMELQTTPANIPAPLPFLLSSPGLVLVDGAVVPKLSLNLDYSGSAIEHQIGKLAGIEDYKPSTWLSYVLDEPNPLAKPLTPKKPIEVPLVLRSFPTVPEMADQDGGATFPDTESDINKATRWDYCFTYSLPFHYPQDTVHGKVQFNVEDPGAARLASFEDAFAQLAQFVTVFPNTPGGGDSVQGDLVEYLAQIDATTTNETVLNNAQVALIAFIQMVENVYDAAQGTAFKVSNTAFDVISSETYEFEISEDVYQDRAGGDGQDEPPANALIISIKNIVGTPGKSEPVVLVGDNSYKPERELAKCAADYCYVYKNDDGSYLSAAEGQRIADREMVIKELDILGRQDAWASVLLKRNADLVKDRTIREEFIYTTGEVRFANPFHPTIVDASPINIAQIPSPPSPGLLGETSYKRTLAEHLDVLFNTLMGKNRPSSLKIQLEVSYQYKINTVLEPVPLPVLFQPPREVSVPPSESTTEATEGTLESMILDLASVDPASLGAIISWFKDQVPSGVDGTLHFDLLLFSDPELTPEPLPLLRLTNLRLPIKDVEPPLVTSVTTLQPAASE